MIKQLIYPLKLTIELGQSIEKSPAPMSGVVPARIDHDAPGEAIQRRNLTRWSTKFPTRSLCLRNQGEQSPRQRRAETPTPDASFLHM
jgi:hypothetical protein